MRIVSIKNRKRPIVSLIIILIGWLGLGAVIWFVPPTNVAVETITLTALTLILFLSLSWIIGRSKKGLAIAVFLMVLLILRRFQIFDWLTLGAALTILGLITLIN